MLNSLKKILGIERKKNIMTKVLYITANPKTVEQSYSLSVGSEFLNAYKKNNPSDEIVHIDVYKADIPFIDEDVLSGWGKLQGGKAFTELTAAEQSKVGKINQLTEQFIAADKYVFVTPLWNFTVPPKMKAYIDTICIAGKSFKYTENGPVGLLNNKKALHIQASGGVYSEGAAKDFEMGNRYIKTVLGFLGVQAVKSLLIEGMAQAPVEAEKIKAIAVEQAKEIANKF